MKREAGRRWMRRNGFLDKETMTNKQECELYYAEPIGFPKGNEIEISGITEI